MASVLAVFWTWKVALSVLSAAAVVWFLLAAFVASRWPDVHPWLGRLRPPRVRAALVGVLLALAVGAAFVSRSAYARSRNSAEEFGRRGAERRLVLLGHHPESRLFIHAGGPQRLTMVHVGHTSPCAHKSANVEVDADFDEEQQEAIAEAQAEAREAAEEARQEAEEARRDAEEKAREAGEEAQARMEEARERAQERAEQARERARERAERLRERAQEIAERQMERAQAVLERMGDEMDSTRDAVEEDLESDSGDPSSEHSKLEAFLERQAEKVERLGHTVAEQLRGLASRFGDDDDDHDVDENHDEDHEVDL